MSTTNHTMEDQKSKAKTAAARMRAAMAEPGILIAPGVFDGFSARLVEKMGFKIAGVSGAGLSESRLGWADMGIMGYQENRDACEQLASCCNVPLIADADTGYGNAINVHFTVQGFERGGLAGVMIEDQVWPKRCGHLAGKEVIPMEEMVQKVRAAVRARRDPDFVIQARTDAAGPLGMAEAIRRANEYADAGADIVFADALILHSDIERFAREVHAPVAVNMGFGLQERATTPLIAPRQLEAMGVKVVCYPRLLTAASLHGMTLAMEAFCSGMLAERPQLRPDLQVGFGAINKLMGIDELVALESAYLTDAERLRKYGDQASVSGSFVTRQSAG